MSYEDMARSHVKELAREAFGLEEVVVDEDGDLPFPCGTAAVYVSVVHGGRLVRVWSRAVAGTVVNKPVLRELDAVNRVACFARALSRHDAVYVEGQLPVETLRAADLAALCAEVGQTADRLGSMLAAVYGGSVAFPDAAEAGHQHED